MVEGSHLLWHTRRRSRHLVVSMLCLACRRRLCPAGHCPPSREFHPSVSFKVLMRTSKIVDRFPRSSAWKRVCGVACGVSDRRTREVLPSSLSLFSVKDVPLHSRLGAPSCLNGRVATIVCRHMPFALRRICLCAVFLCLCSFVVYSSLPVLSVMYPTHERVQSKSVSVLSR